MNKRMQKGFTLIELMIVVAIIAILAAIAIPAYQDYLIRAQVSEGAVLTGGAQTAFSEYFSNHGTMPTTNLAAGIAKSSSITGKYVTGVAIASSVITATFGGQANKAIANATFVLSPVVNVGSISWTCTKSTVNTKYLPSSCR